MGKFRYKGGGETVEVEYSYSDGHLQVGEQSFECDGKSISIEGRKAPFWVHKVDDKVLVWLDGVVHDFEVDDPRRRSASDSGGGPAGGKVKAQMPGKILQVAVKVGEQVEVDQNLLLMESMKMELALDASVAGVVKAVDVKPGQMVAQGELLVEIEES